MIRPKMYGIVSWLESTRVPGTREITWFRLNRWLKYLQLN